MLNSEFQNEDGDVLIGTKKRKDSEVKIEVDKDIGWVKEREEDCVIREDRHEIDALLLSPEVVSRHLRT